MRRTTMGTLWEEKQKGVCLPWPEDPVFRESPARWAFGGTNRKLRGKLVRHHTYHFNFLSMHKNYTKKKIEEVYENFYTHTKIIK